MELLRDFQLVNIFGAYQFQAPIILVSSVFFVLYAIIIYIAYSGINSYQAYKIWKLNTEINQLKSELYTHQKDLLTEIRGDYAQQLEKFKKDNDNKFETIIRYNEYTLEKVIEESQGSFTKYRKETLKILKDTGSLESGVLDKLKIWK
jgi:hypothetical protein